MSGGSGTSDRRWPAHFRPTTLAFAAALLAAPAQAQQNYFPIRPLGPEPEHNYKWVPSERYVVGETYLEGAYRYRVGRTPDGYTYQIWHSGHASLEGFGEVWSIRCGRDAMTDAFNCQLYSLSANTILVYFGSSTTPGAVCALGHNYPGRTGAIRIDANPPRPTDTSGCIGPEILPELTNGRVVRTRIVAWPYDYPVDREGTLQGLSQAFRLIRHLQAYFSHMNF